MEMYPLKSFNLDYLGNNINNNASSYTKLPGLIVVNIRVGEKPILSEEMHFSCDIQPLISQCQQLPLTTRNC